jgi:hypothetical protein
MVPIYLHSLCLKLTKFLRYRDSPWQIRIGEEGKIVDCPYEDSKVLLHSKHTLHTLNPAEFFLLLIVALFRQLYYRHRGR